MAMRLDEVVSGIKADVALKIYGEDPRVLEQKAEQALRLISGVPGAADEQMEILSGVAELRVAVNRKELARYGLNVSAVREIIETAVGGRYVADMIEGQRRFAMMLRLPDEYRRDADSIRNLLLSAPGGERVRLGQVASVEAARGPEVISRENGQRRIVVQCNVRGRDIGGFVKEAQERIASEVKLPPGYVMRWGGTFEHMESGRLRLMVAVPVTFLLIFVLLFATFRSMGQAALIFTGIPFAITGGVLALWVRGMHFSMSAGVGFIAVSGVAVLNGVVMVAFINQLREGGAPVRQAIMEGAITRLRPVLMTALVASLGFVPMALSTSAGAEVQKPLATVVIGGLATSTLLTLLVLPIGYRLFEESRLRRRMQNVECRMQP
jgi:cobalt-zinc-cadmium resistance protein CzcA